MHIRRVGLYLGSCRRSLGNSLAELAQLTAATPATSHVDGPIVWAIAGPGRIGKTWLTLRWAHQHADRFPDGQLFVDLRGFDPSDEPTHPAAAVRGFLDAFGVEPHAIPIEPDAQVSLYRSLVVDKRILIVLDNSRQSAQVTPLLPGSSSRTVLITSRNRLNGLITAHGANPLPVEALSEADARTLLSRRLGADRLAAESEATAELLAFCEGFPLALSIVAGRVEAMVRIPRPQPPKHCHRPRQPRPKTMERLATSRAEKAEDAKVDSHLIPDHFRIGCRSGYPVPGSQPDR